MDNLIDLYNEAKDTHFDYLIKGVKIEDINRITSEIDDILLDLSTSAASTLQDMVDKDLVSNLLSINHSLKQDKFGLNAGYLIKDNVKLHYIRAIDINNVPIIKCEVEKL